MTPLDTTVTRTDLEHAVDRVTGKLDKMAESIQEAALVGVANQVRIDELTLKVGRVHEKTTRLSDEIVAYKAVTRSDGRVVRVRDVALTGCTLTVAYAVLHFLKVL